jgi:hypothetical protein
MKSDDEGGLFSKMEPGMGWMPPEEEDDAPIKLEYQRPFLYKKQEDAIFTEKRIACIEASTKSGKAQPLGSLVYTPTGPVRMGDLSVGDAVCTPTGSVSFVRAIYPQGSVPVHELMFSDGASCRVTGDHLWDILIAEGRAKRVTTTEFIELAQASWRRARIPIAEHVAFVPQPVPLDPYLLGVLIGDGNMKFESLKLSSADQEIIDNVESLLPEGFTLKPDGGYDFKIVGEHVDAYGRMLHTKLGVVTHGSMTHPLIQALKVIGLWGCGSESKFIPAIYKYNSAEVRWKILQGIFDSDGWVQRDGQPRIDQTSERLARDIGEVIESLGGAVRTTTKKGSYCRANGGRVACRVVYRSYIRHAEAPHFFQLKRKRERARPKKRGFTRRLIASKRLASEPCQCIEIDDPNGLYLTDRFIVTHNTVGCMAWLMEQGVKNGGKNRNFWWIAPSRRQAQDVFDRWRAGVADELIQYNKTERSIAMLADETKFWFLTGEEPDLLYGTDVYAAVGDEASRQREEAWIALQTTLTATRGPVRLIGNVKGRKNWFYRLCRRAEKGDDPSLHYAKITAIDAIEAGVLEAGVVEDARKYMPADFYRELYFAEAAEDEGNPFGLDNIAACIAEKSSDPPVCWGWDFARTVDWTVGIGLDKDGHVCQFYRWQNVPWRMQVQRIKVLSGTLPTLVDSTGVGDPVLEYLQADRGGMRNFEGYKFTQQSKMMLVEGLIGAIQGKEIRFPYGAISIELESFEYEYTRTGILYTAPEGMNDDWV